jgi:hypothetical protein
MHENIHVHGGGDFNENHERAKIIRLWIYHMLIFLGLKLYCVIIEMILKL